MGMASKQNISNKMDVSNDVSADRTKHQSAESNHNNSSTDKKTGSTKPSSRYEDTASILD